MAVKLRKIGTRLAAWAAMAWVVGASLPLPAAAAQGTPPGPAIETSADAIAQDALVYSRQHVVGLNEATRRLEAQQETVAATDRLRGAYKDRLAGIAIEHEPEYRIVVLLTGSDPVPDEVIHTAAMDVPVIFQTGALATRDRIVAAMRRYQALLRAELPAARGMGLDERTGELVLLLNADDAQRLGSAAIEARAEAIAGVPVRVRVTDAIDTNMVVGGGSRIDGIVGEEGRRFVCTSGFAVTDGTRTGLMTAAHCPDTVTYHDPDGGTAEMPFVGQWGARYQDVQINLSPSAAPLFYADRKAGALRPLTSWRNRASTRAGDFVCHYGEGSGYSCAEVELTDFSPPGDLCGGPCEPEWVTVRGPGCRGGDSGGPVFSGTIAFGILKGGNRIDGSRCNFYYYMSTDFMPRGWSLLHR